MERKIIIAIDGYSSCGKSTLAKQLAEKLGYIYVDSGAMYRAVTYYFMQHHVDLKNEEQIKNALDQIEIKFKYNPQQKRNETYLNGQMVEDVIRSMEVSNLVSPVSAIPAVRDFLVEQQQQMGKERGLVMDGRDIGTIVFPDAELKLFMKANKGIRAQRRWLELKEKGIELPFEEILKNLESRDFEDTHRAYNPLRKAEDAVELDNSELTHQEQLYLVLKTAKEIIG
jgi:cytidylate kinase